MSRMRWIGGSAAIFAAAASTWAEQPVVQAEATHECLPAVILPFCPPGHRRPIEPPRPYGPIQPPPVAKDPATPSPVPSTPSPPTPTPGPTDPVARAPEAGTLAPSTFNANMFGDAFSGSPLRFAPSRTLTFILSGIPGILPSQVVPAQPIPYHPASAQSPTNTLLPRPGAVVFLHDNGGVVSFAAPPFQTVAAFNPQPAPSTLPLQENAQVTAGLQTLNPGAGVVFLPEGSRADLVNISLIEYYLTQSYRIDTVAAALIVPHPGGGGVVGRTKIADDNSPLPRDRLILGADYFSNTVLSPNGFDVTRFSPGIEYTFFDQWASIEARFPFASTVDNAIDSTGITNRAAEYGNVNLTFKGLVMRGSEFNLAAGFGLSLPTGPDAIVRGSGGSELLRINNESWIVTPYVAALFTPDDRLFAQAWLQVGFDTTGSPVYFNPGQSGLVNVGRLHDQTLLSTDLQIGYWVLQDRYGDGLRGLAPFVELHYNTPINDAELIRTNGLTIGSLNNRYDEVNLTLGVTALYGDNLLVSAGFVTPLRPAPDRFFDYQIGLRANWLFGAPVAMGGYAPLPAGGPVRAPSPMAGMPGGVADPMAPAADPVARAPETGTLAPNTFNPNFFGDQVGLSRTHRGAVPVRVPLFPRYIGLKPGENDGPRPMDRAYFSYNTYSGVNSSVNPPGTPDIWLRRQIVGVESTIGPDASVGFRVPFIQSGGDPTFEAREIGDLSVFGKYALVNDEAGNVISVGTILTLPTGGRGESLALLDDGSVAPRAIFFTPWAGAALANGDWFAQGVTSVVLPADPVYPIAWFNSVGVGYWIYRNRADTLVQALVPVAELHINTPLNNRGDDALIFFDDQVNLTTGLYLQFPRLTVGAAVCVPLLNPKPYDLEMMLNVNYQF